jgi:hypothetical protein
MCRAEEVGCIAEHCVGVESCALAAWRLSARIISVALPVRRSNTPIEEYFVRTVFFFSFAALLFVVLTCTSRPLHAQAFASAKSAAVDYSRADVSPRGSCEALAHYNDKGLRELHVAPIKGGDFAPGNCRISGLLAPEIAFEVSLPDHWNGRFYMFGNGGHAGEALDDPNRIAQRDRALQLGFAVAQTNTGHDGRKEPGASFVMSNPQKAIDYAYQAVNSTVHFAKRLTTHYYGKPVARSYWNSCSNGGRQGLIEAQRYPEDFDGVLANSPWVDQTGFTIGALWNERAVAGVGLTAAKMSTLANAVLSKCDALDGVKDGLIDDPRRCQFDARTDVPACPAGNDAESCLTPGQSAAVMKVYQGPSSHGKAIFPGFMVGSEAIVPTTFGGGKNVTGWMGVILTDRPEQKAADFNLAEGTMRYLVHTPPQPSYDWRTFDFDRDTGLLDAWGRKANATDPDLSKFRHRGGKLLMTYGWADAILQPLMGVDYYQQAVVTNGPQTADFFRLFMVPGMGHCGGGTGTDRFDAMTALIDWVENGKAPDMLLASQVVDNRTTRSRPLCPYPQVARYAGQGSIDAAESFSCKDPR